MAILFKRRTLKKSLNLGSQNFFFFSPKSPASFTSNRFFQLKHNIAIEVSSLSSSDHFTDHAL